jgi:hypothetical protein
MVAHCHRLITDQVHGLNGRTRLGPTNVGELFQRRSLEGIARIEQEHWVIGAGTDVVDDGRHLGEGAYFRRPIAVIVERQDRAVEIRCVKDGQLGAFLASGSADHGCHHDQRQRAQPMIMIPIHIHL